MADEKKPRRLKTDADRLAELKDAAKRAQAKATAAQERYMVALNAAHEKAKAAVASLPPLPKSVAVEP